MRHSVLCFLKRPQPVRNQPLVWTEPKPLATREVRPLSRRVTRLLYAPNVCTALYRVRGTSPHDAVQKSHPRNRL